MLDGALQQRTFTALILAPLAIAGVLFFPTIDVALALGLIMLLAAWEWTSLAGIVTRMARLAYVALIGMVLLLLWHALPDSWVTYVLVVLALWWAGLALVLLRTQVIAPARGLDFWLLLIGLIVLVGPWLAIVHLHAVPDHGPWLVVFFFLLIWTTDTAAYLVGRQWGRAKLAPVLSPGKTWAGVFGALVGAIICGFLLSWMLGLPMSRIVLAVVVCALSASISMIGDLYESLLKRRRGVKDAGHLLPGHGGVLDRIDSLTAAAPVFTLGILWLGAQS